MDKINSQYSIDTYMRAVYAKMAKQTLQDLRNNKTESIFFSKYTKDDIVKWLMNPSSSYKQLRNVCNYLYMTSSHFRILINHFAFMPLFSYILIPYNLNTEKVNQNTFKNAYTKTLDEVNKMNIPHEYKKILRIAFREDVFFGYTKEEEDSFFIMQIPFDYAKISSIEDGVYNYSFDFSYFDTYPEKLDSYGSEFIKKYNKYKNSGSGNKKNSGSLRWQEIDSENSICIKVNEDVIHPIPPFAGVLEALYDIEDFKALQKVRTEFENTHVMTFEIPLDDQKNVAMDNDIRKMYIGEIDEQLDEKVGYVVSPFKTNSFSFDRSTSVLDNVAIAEQEYFNAAGVSQMLFNGNKTSSAALKESIKSDFDIVATVLRQLERWTNRRLKNLSTKYKFKISILDVSRYNQEDMFNMYIKAGQAGVPVKQAIAATLGYNPSDIMNMGFLENDILKLRDTTFSQPLLSSSTMSPDSEPGAPTEANITEAGEQTREDETNNNRV